MIILSWSVTVIHWANVIQKSDKAKFQIKNCTRPANPTLRESILNIFCHVRIGHPPRMFHITLAVYHAKCSIMQSLHYNYEMIFSSSIFLVYFYLSFSDYLVQSDMACVIVRDKSIRGKVKDVWMWSYCNLEVGFALNKKVFLWCSRFLQIFYHERVRFSSLVREISPTHDYGAVQLFTDEFVYLPVCLLLYLLIIHKIRKRKSSVSMTTAYYRGGAVDADGMKYIFNFVFGVMILIWVSDIKENKSVAGKSPTFTRIWTLKPVKWKRTSPGSSLPFSG